MLLLYKIMIKQVEVWKGQKKMLSWFCKFLQALSKLLLKMWLLFIVVCSISERLFICLMMEMLIAMF